MNKRHITSLIASLLVAGCLCGQGALSASADPIRSNATTTSSGAHAASDDGTYPLVIRNDTHGHWADEDVWVLIVGQSSPGQWAYVRPDGAVRSMDVREESGPGAISKDGRSYAPMAFRMPADGTVRMPENLEGTRVYLSLGAPLYIGITPSNNHPALPDAASPSDPNYNTNWDHYELTFVNGKVAFGGNPTQVDHFGFPIVARVEQASTGYDRTSGVTASRDEVFKHFKELGDGYASLVSDKRVLAPRTSRAFATSSEASKALAQTIDDTWKHYATNDLVATAAGKHVVGRVTGDRDNLHFTADGVGDFVITKPSPSEVWGCSGTMASGNDVELALEAQLCAAFNRDVADNVADWSQPAKFYERGAGNQYSAYFHSVSVDKLAYGFSYDDVFDQSSVLILNNPAPPSKVTLTIGW